MGELDAEGGRRTHELTDLLVDELELGVLWDEYGIIGDIMVSLFPLYSIRSLSSAFIGLSIFITLLLYSLTLDGGQRYFSPAYFPLGQHSVFIYTLLLSS